MAPEGFESVFSRATTGSKRIWRLSRSGRCGSHFKPPEFGGRRRDRRESGLLEELAGAASLHPPHRRVEPSRRDHSRRRRGLGATRTMKQPALQAPGFGAVDRTIGGGSLSAPPFRPTKESGIRRYARKPQRGPTSPASPPGGIESKEVRKKGGSDLCSYESGPECDPGEGKQLTGIGGRSSTAKCACRATIAGCGRSFRPELPVLRRPSPVP